MARLFSLFFTVFPAALTLAACEPASMLATGATMVSVIQSEETLTDKALSWALDKKCSIFQAARGEQYCRSKGPDLPAQYCYRNLGGITCYSQPDPNASQEIAVYATPPEPAAPATAGDSAPAPARNLRAQRVPAH